MKVITTVYFIQLIPDEGKALTDGEFIAEGEVYLPLSSNKDLWYEIDRVEKNEEEI